MQARQMSSDYLIQFCLGAIAHGTVFLLISIFLFLFITGIGSFEQISPLEFFFSTDWNPTAYSDPSWGVGALIMGTIIISVTSLVIVVPGGMAIAIYLAELAAPKTREFLKPLIEMIASIPSVVLGLLGLLIIAPLVATIFRQPNGLNALTASFLVSIAALPTVASICEDALSSVRRSYREASYALGATQWQTIRQVVIPAARSGLLAGIMLGFGRIIGETMIVLMVAGNSRAFPKSLLDPVRPMTATIAIDIKEVVVGSLHWESLFAIASVLFVVTFILNMIADLLIHKELPL